MYGTLAMRSALAQLKDLKKERDSTLGLCQIQHAWVLKKYFLRWPEFSGEITYPVPGKKGECPIRAFIEAVDMWNRRTIYGRRRWALWQFVIDELEKDLAC